MARTIQISNTGISPGAGVGNHRMKINEESLGIPVIALGVYTRIYELDLLKEFKNEGGKKKVIVLDTVNDEEVKANATYYFSFNDEKLGEIEDVFACLSYLVYGQLISLVKSAKLGINPDNPCPTGEVNRVVKGVIMSEDRVCGYQAGHYEHG